MYKYPDTEYKIGDTVFIKNENGDFIKTNINQIQLIVINNFHKYFYVVDKSDNKLTRRELYPNTWENSILPLFNSSERRI